MLQAPGYVEYVLRILSGLDAAQCLSRSYCYSFWTYCVEMGENECKRGLEWPKLAQMFGSGCAYLKAFRHQSISPFKS